MYSFPWTKTLLVESADVDFNKTLRPTTLNRYIQEIAWQHASALGVGYDNHRFENISWILVRLDISITGSLPSWGETIHIHTQPTGIESLYAIREFYGEIETSKGNREFCRATSSWVMINTNTRRIVKPQGFLDDLVRPDVIPVTTKSAEKLSFPHGEWLETSSILPGYNDIDVNNHVNNCSYLEWVLDSIPRETFEFFTYKRIVLNYLSETHWGNTVKRYTMEETPSGNEDKSTIHKLCVPLGGQEKIACLGKIDWMKSNTNF